MDAGFTLEGHIQGVVRFRPGEVAGTFLFNSLKRGFKRAVGTASETLCMLTALSSEPSNHMMKPDSLMA